MISAYHVAKHADAVVELLQVLAKLLGGAGRPADAALAMARAALAALTDERTPSDPAAIRQLAADLRDQLAAHDKAAAGALAAKFDRSEP